MSVNPLLTRDQVLKYLTYLVGKGRLLRIKDMVPFGGYEVNLGWISALLDQEGGPTKVMFLNVVLRDHKFYFFVVKDTDEKKDGAGQSSRMHLNSNAMRDDSSKVELGHEMSSKSDTTRHNVPTAALSLYHRPQNLFNPPQKPGLTILLDTHNTPTHMSILQSLNPHLATSEILSRLQERADAGHMERFDIDVYRWNVDWLRKTLSTEEGRKQIGYAYDGRLARKRSDYPRTMVSSREPAKDG
ncbi:hypothetical protein IFR04_011376 [Cadophora malorum]|uniref:Uncharacterized protein n=1 Tax=Cadophora malorum TaxID=108018 RepID=A0A8H7T5F7_9HELO|nr:hypothetical protein IFR04_011376 [Cadophora malorum]